MSGFTAVVFCGPTIGHAAVREILDDAICRPPAAMGDVYRCLDEKPHCIAIIDGYFEGVLSVWHKEILYAMAQGVHVLGASSMGALRAAELADFGMRGVGKIFQQFRCGELEDDDEVAVLHGPEELQFAAVSEAMVNIRETLAAAVAGAVLDARDADELCAIAKSCFYQDRGWKHILSLAAPVLGAATVDKFGAWLAQGAVDRKRLDALALLREVEKLKASKPPPFEAPFSFEWSEMWQNAIALRDDEPPAADGIDALVLDELRLDAPAYADALLQAGLQHLAQGENPPAGGPVSDPELRRVFNEFRERNGLLDRRRLDDWLRGNDLDAAQFERLMASLARRERLLDGLRGELDRALLDWLRLGGRYPALRARALSKQDALACTRRRLAEEDRPGLRRWYFEERLSMDVPAALDAFLQRAGFAGPDHFYRAVFDEWVYCRLDSGQTQRPEQDASTGPVSRRAIRSQTSPRE